jgi:prevent-host-death family protein
MKLSTHIKPISYLKAHASEVIRDLGQRREPMVITQHGEAKAVMMDVKSYEQAQETLALLKILALGNRQIDEEQVSSVDDVFRRIRERRSPQK